MRAPGLLALLALLLPRPAAATCTANLPRFEPLEATASRPLAVRWNLGGACCSGGGQRQSCTTTPAAPGCHALQRLDAFGAPVAQPCLELRASPTDSTVLVATRTLEPGAWLLEGHGFVVASEDPLRAPEALEHTGPRGATVALGLAAAGRAVAAAWASPGGPLTLRVFDEAGRARTYQLGTLGGAPAPRVAVVPLHGGWLVGAGDRLARVRRNGTVQTRMLPWGQLEALAPHGRGGRLVVRSLDGGVALVDVDEGGRALGAARALPPAARWELLAIDGGMLAAGLNGPSPPHLVKVLGDGRLASRSQGWSGLSDARVGTTTHGFVLYDAAQRQELDLDGRPSTEPLPGGLRGPRDGELGLELDERVNAAFARAADAPGPRVLVEGSQGGLGEPQVVALADRTLVVGWVSPDGPRLARVAVPPGQAALGSAAEAPGSSCSEDPVEACGLHPFGRGCRRLSCGRTVLESSFAAGEGRLWAALLEGERPHAGQRCAAVIEWPLDGGAPQSPLVHPCVGGGYAQRVAIAGTARPLVAVEGTRGVEVFAADSGRRVLEVPGGRNPVLVGAEKTLLLVEQDLATIEAHVVGGEGGAALFEAPVSALSAAATPRGFVVMAVRSDETAVLRFVDLRGRASRPLTLEGSSGWLVPGPSVTRVFYLDGRLVEQTLSAQGVPLGAPRPQVTPVFHRPVTVGSEQYLLSPWSDEHTLELRHLSRDGG